MSFDVATLDDVYAEPAEQFQVSVSKSETSGGGYEKAPALPGAVTTTITDEDGSDPKLPTDAPPAMTLTLTGDANGSRGKASYTPDHQRRPENRPDHQGGGGSYHHRQR